jgi:fumarate reductase flavoprotein subunit
MSQQEAADLVVVGAGLAGHAAALTAAEEGLTVLLLEKGDTYGGSSVLAGGGLVFAGTDLQRDAGVEDSVADLRATLFEVGRGLNDPDTVEAYLDHQLDTYTWLRARGALLDYSPDLQPGQLNRLHGSTPGQVTDALHRHVAEHPSIDYQTRTSACRLIRGPDERVVGVVTEGVEGRQSIPARRGVVLASGGFARSNELLAVFAPQWLATTRMGGAHNTGDGLRMAMAVGAGLADMSQIQASFGASVNRFPDLAEDDAAPPRLLFANSRGAVIVNREAQRFCNESLNYKQISISCARQRDGLAFQIFDSAVMACSQLTPSPSDFRGALEEGTVWEAESLESLALVMGLEPEALVRTINRYNASVDAGIDEDFDRPVSTGRIGRIETPPFYAYPCRCGLTTTYCGVTVSRKLEVLDVFGRPIVGLWAAGEVVGGFHGAGYYSGSALGKAAVFGRAAALSAAESPQVA